MSYSPNFHKNDDQLLSDYFVLELGITPGLNKIRSREFMEIDTIFLEGLTICAVMTKGGHSVPCQVYYRLQDILPAAEDIGMGYPSVLVNKQSDRVYLDVDMTREELLKYLHDQLRTANLP